MSSGNSIGQIDNDKNDTINNIYNYNANYNYNTNHMLNNEQHDINESNKTSSLSIDNLPFSLPDKLTHINMNNSNNFNDNNFNINNNDDNNINNNINKNLYQHNNNNNPPLMDKTNLNGNSYFHKNKKFNLPSHKRYKFIDQSYNMCENDNLSMYIKNTYLFE